MTVEPSTAPAPAAPEPRAKRIGVLIVAYNAVTTLVKVLRRVPKEAWKDVEQVVVFDDASQDHTYELAVGFKATTDLDASKLQVFRHSQNLGYGGNQKAGYRYFIEQGFDIVVLLHGDGQYAPEMLPEMYGPLVRGEAEAVFGSRMMRDFGGPLKGGMPLYKYAGNRILTIFENRALNLNLTEFHSGYRAYSLAALRQIDFTHMTNDFHFDTEIIVKLQHQGFRIKEVPIPTYYGDEICHVNGMKYAWNVARAVRRYRQTTRSLRKHPEFSEYWVHYPVKESRYSSHDYLFRYAGSGQRILDVGCGEGFTAGKLAGNGNRVTGIDALEHPAHPEAFEGYVSCDLFAGLQPAVRQLRGARFDRVLFMDVLEHLPQPEQMLRDTHALLSESGQVLVSVPNVANITVRLSLLLGRFEYQARGILDRTHIRFYTRRTARRMIEEAGYEIVRELPTVMPVELALGVSARNPLMRLTTRLLYLATRVMPSLLGYQFFFIARPRKA